MTAITTRSKSSLPVPTRAIDDLIDRFTGRMQETSVPGIFEISEACAPSGEVRAVLAGRADYLTAALAPSEAEHISRCVSSLRVVLPSRATNAEAARMELALTIRALEQMPEWAVAEICLRYLDGRLGNGRFAPTPPELAKACRELIAPVQTEAAKIRRILNAEVYREPTDEERASTAARMKEIMRTFSADPEADEIDHNHPQNTKAA